MAALKPTELHPGDTSTCTTAKGASELSAHTPKRAYSLQIPRSIDRPTVASTLSRSPLESCPRFIPMPPSFLFSAHDRLAPSRARSDNAQTGVEIRNFGGRELRGGRLLYSYCVDTSRVPSSHCHQIASCSQLHRQPGLRIIISELHASSIALNRHGCPDLEPAPLATQLSLCVDLRTT